ncbi:heme biosynthesis HemY N-terminal domain-containing protein [Pseudothauera rhizosphaerae]|uniref:Heme biosynthesis protein HemY n=1 Tax=Pseudothauera rhizosphaerae TaxID=2565932 RepID=A0A4S4AWN7_9RHOO|nr:heme biosynthesis HemY N-terminal domain-containing protein [Pseudothauera rhizosphaerae]THF64421.1 heme biosynthesis protein HemY [Pseudothauera rhizosphaerae]
MRALIWLIGIFALAAAIAVAGSINTGYVLLAVPPYRVQLSLNLVIIGLLAAFFVAYLLVRVLHNTLALPGAVRAFRERRRRDKAGRMLRDALRTLFEGRYAQALKLAEKSCTLGERTPAAALVAARAAHAMRDETRYKTWIGRIAEYGDAARAARLMTEAELAVEDRDFQLAAERLETLRLLGNRQIAALRLSLRVASALHRWDEVLKLARQLYKHKALSDEQVAPLVRRAHVERMRELGGDGKALSDYWKAIPAAEMKDRRLVERAVPLLVAGGQGALARRKVEQLLDAEWDSGLARLYALCGQDDAVACLAKAEEWLKRHPQDAGLLHALGRLCLQAQLWGKAQSYLELSLKQDPAVETHLSLAGLLEQLGRGEEAQEHYRAAAKVSAEPAAQQGSLPVAI